MNCINKDLITSCFKELDVKHGDTIFVHSSLSSIGNECGSAVKIIEVLQNYVGSNGTLIMPTFTDNLTEPFDVSTTPSDVGIMTETFRKTDNVIRSLHPTHSVCAKGRHAAYIAEGHNLSPTPCGRNTPFYKVFELKGKVILIGVDMNRNTMLHAIEEEAGVPYLIEGIELPAPTYIKNHEGRTITIEKYPAGHRDFLKLTHVLRREKLMKEAFIGQATVKVIEVEQLFKLVLNILREKPDYFLCNSSYCNSCIAAKAKIYGLNLSYNNINNKCCISNCEVCSI